MDYACAAPRMLISSRAPGDRSEHTIAWDNTLSNLTKQNNNMTTSHTVKKNILFVEVDKEAQELVTLTLALAGYGIVIARDCAEGLRLARQQYFELYILDNWLPDGSGVELCHRIREFDKHTPILLYSSAGYVPNTQDVLDAGAQGYLIKPVEVQDLRRTVARLFSAFGINDAGTCDEEITTPGHT